MTDPVSTMREIKKVKRENKRNLFQTEVIMQEHSEEGTFKQRPNKKAELHKKPREGVLDRTEDTASTKWQRAWYILGTESRLI